MDPNRDQQAPGCATLHAYLLGAVDFETALTLQRRLHFDVSGDRDQAALILCEHPPCITIGREGSRRHVLCEPEELRVRQWRVRWINRGGGCWLHLPGQLCVYPIVPLDRLGLTPPEFVLALGEVIRNTLDDFSVRANVRVDEAGVWAGGRLLAGLGVAVKDWITYHGACFNLHPALDCYRLVRSHPRARESMTSLERERRGPVRPALVRERLLEHFRERFAIGRVALFSDHRLLHAPQRGVRFLRAR
jgi:lipoyl(octanoyl) transferase